MIATDTIIKGKYESENGINPSNEYNPVLSVDKNGYLVYSNEATEPLLNKWSVKVGEKLPSSMVDLVQRVISRNNPEKMEIKVGNRTYLVVFSPLPEQELTIISGFDISEQKEIEEHLLEAYEQIKTQSEELSVSNRDLRVQSDELNEANTLLHDSVIGFRTLAENSPDLITRFDRQDRCIYANPAAKLFDIPLNPEMVKLSEKLRNNAFTTGKSEAVIFHYTSPKGKKYWFDTKVIPEFANNEVVSILVIYSDITNLKEAEAILRSSNLYNRSLIEASLDPLVIIGNDGCVTDVNKATEQATGYSRNDLIGTYFAQYLTEPDQAISALIHVCTHGELRDCALEIKHRDGRITPVLCNASVYRDENGKVIGVFVAARDITELKKAEKALKKAHDSLEERVKERTEELEKAYISLKESEKSLAEAQKMAHIGNWERNLATNKIYLSDEVYRIFGFDPKEFGLTHNKFISCLHSEDREHVDHAIKESIKGKPYDIIYRIILPEGEERIVNSHVRAIFDEKNNPILLRGVVQDITERKKAEEAMARIEISRKQEIHHRIKNNLQVISSLLDLQADKFNDQKVIEAFRESQNRVISMAFIHEELHKGEGFEKLNFSSYVKELASNLLLTYRIGIDNINLNTDLDQNVFFDMDTAVPLGIIINELVSNSLKYAFTGRNEGEIQIKLHREESSNTNFNLSVSDNGIGIPENLNVEDLESLGLQLVTTLVEQIDGELELKRNNGTEFTIQFSVKENSDQEQAPSKLQCIQ